MYFVESWMVHHFKMAIILKIICKSVDPNAQLNEE